MEAQMTTAVLVIAVVWLLFFAGPILVRQAALSRKLAEAADRSVKGGPRRTEGADRALAARQKLAAIQSRIKSPAPPALGTLMVNSVIKEFSKGLENIVDLKKLDAVTPGAEAAGEASETDRIVEMLRHPFMKQILREWSFHIKTGQNSAVFAGAYLEWMRDPSDPEKRQLSSVFISFMKPRGWPEVVKAVASGLDGDLLKEDVLEVFNSERAGPFYDGFRAVVLGQIRHYWDQFLGFAEGRLRDGRWMRYESPMKLLRLCRIVGRIPGTACVHGHPDCGCDIEHEAGRWTDVCSKTLIQAVPMAGEWWARRQCARHPVTSGDLKEYLFEGQKFFRPFEARGDSPFTKELAECGCISPVNFGKGNGDGNAA